MTRFTIKVGRRTSVTYFPKERRKEGFAGEIEGLPNSLIFTLIKPGAKLVDVEGSFKSFSSTSNPRESRGRRNQEVP